MTHENQFTPPCRGEALRLAQEAAEEMGHGYVGCEHILLGLMREEDGIAHRVMQEYGMTEDMICTVLERSVGKGLSGAAPSQGLTPGPRVPWSWPCPRPCAWAPGTSVPNICSWACCGKATTWPFECWTPWASTPRRCTAPWCRKSMRAPCRRKRQYARVPSGREQEGQDFG